MLEQRLKEEWAARLFVGQTQEESYQRNFLALGQVDMLQRLQEATVEDIGDRYE